MRKTDKGWFTSGAANFDMKSNKQRPDGWTPADAAATTDGQDKHEAPLSEPS
jgi:hypothetical protein